MNQEKELPRSAGAFLMIIGGLIWAMMLLCDWLFGIGLILDPFFFNPLAWGIFWIVHKHNDVPMVSGKRWQVAFATIAIGFIPGLDGLIPEWLIYAAYLTFGKRSGGSTQSIMTR